MEGIDDRVVRAGVSVTWNVAYCHDLEFMSSYPRSNFACVVLQSLNQKIYYKIGLYTSNELLGNVLLQTAVFYVCTAHYLEQGYVMTNGVWENDKLQRIMKHHNETRKVLHNKLIRCNKTTGYFIYTLKNYLCFNASSWNICQVSSLWTVL